jgi:hypothetical protein
MENKDRLYGQLVIDFANAKTSDEACLKLLENMQGTFGLPPDFAEKARAIPSREAEPIPMKKDDSTAPIGIMAAKQWLK